MLSRGVDKAERIAIGGHVRPDGDCVGACMGLSRYIKENYEEKIVDVYLEEIPKPFEFLEGTDEIFHELPERQQYDLFICLDCGDKDRLGFSASLFEQAKHTFCIDHHISNRDFAEENYVVPEASSTSELVYQFLETDKISKSCAEALYLGIVHDTGVFQYSNVAPSTFLAAAELLKKGVDAPKLIQDTYYMKTYAQNQILGRALMESRLLMEGKVIACQLEKSMLDFYGVTPKDLDGIVSHLRNTKGVHVAIFMYELEPGTYKVSLRSDDRVDVSVIAGEFGGGGHKKAAGLTMTGVFHQNVSSLCERIEEQLRGEV